MRIYTINHHGLRHDYKALSFPAHFFFVLLSVIILFFHKLILYASCDLLLNGNLQSEMSKEFFREFP